jgi:hypothetical protein
MADDIPPGLHPLLKEKESNKVLRDAVGSSKDVVDNLIKALTSDDYKKTNKDKFNQDLAKERKEFVKRNNEILASLKKQNETEEAINEKRAELDQELKSFLAEQRKEFKKNNEEQLKSIQLLKNDVDKQFVSYQDFQKQILEDVKRLRASGASAQEITAYLKKNEDWYQENTKDMVSALDKVRNELGTITDNDKNLNMESKYILNKQLRVLEKSYDLQEANFNKQSKIFEQMNEDLERLRESEEETKKKERRQQRGKFKDTLLTTMLGPFRLIADPLLKAVNNNRDTFETLSNRTEKAEARYEIYESSRVELNKLADEQREEGRLAALMSGADTSTFEKPTITDAGIKALKESFTPKALLTGLKESLGFGEMSFAEHSEMMNRQDATDAFFGKAKGIPKALLKGLFTRNKQGHQALPITTEPLALPSPVSEEAAMEQGHQALPITTELDEDEIDPMLAKISPDQNTLLAKGGVVGAGIVFLAKKLGLITDALGDETKKDKEGLGKNVLDFVKKNGLGLLKVAAPLAVAALGGVMIAKGLEMQRRDTDDSRRYFDEGNTARGVETFLLGDRARLTEENANQELGRTAGKTALMAGGAGLVAAGGAGTAAMIGTVASAGGLAAAGGLGAVGTAGLAAMGAALPPALIAAAVITAGMVVAKGTQEAFELGWDKNQAIIQKELTDTMLSEDSTLIEKIKAVGASLWKGLTGSLAGGIREAGKVLDAESMIQNEKQINFIKEQAESGSESHKRLFEMMLSEQFQAMSEIEQKSAMQAEGLYDEFKEAQEATKRTLGEHLITAGRTVGGFFSGLIDTTMEGMRGRETAVWEKAALKGMENMTGDDVARLQQSSAYREAMENGEDHKKAMEAAYLSEEREKAVARGDLREDGMAVQQGNWLAGMAAGTATGNPLGMLAGALGGAAFGKYLGFGDTGMAYKKKQSDEEYRQTFEYSKKKAELMGQGMTAEEADLAAIEEQNALYDQAVTLRLKQSKDYKKVFDQKLKEGKSIKEAEEAALKMAKENKRNTMTTTELVKDKFTEIGSTLRGWAGNIGNYFKDKFSEDGDGFAGIAHDIAEGIKGIWSALSEWFSGVFNKLGDTVRGAAGKIGEGCDWLKDKAGDAWSWATGLFSGGDSPDKINDGIVTKDGKVIELSPDDNVYATKNEPKVIRDREAQRAMPDVPIAHNEFTDVGIIKAIEVLTEVLRHKDLAPSVITQGESVNFDQFRMADVLI